MNINATASRRFVIRLVHRLFAMVRGMDHAARLPLRIYRRTPTQ